MFKSHRNSGNLLMFVIEIIIGVLLLINPISFTTGIIIVFGAVLTIWGVASLIAYFKDSPDFAARGNQLSKGLLLICIGLFCLFKSEWFILTFPLLTVIYGIFSLVTALNKVQWAVDMLRLKQKFWFVTLCSAVLTLIFSVLILSNPFDSTSILWTFVAIALIVEAVIDLVAFILGKRTNNA